MPIQTDIGSLLEPAVSLQPQAISGAADVNGGGVDRLGTPAVYMYYSCMLTLAVGASTGTPTSFTVDCRLQDSADNTTFADFKPDGVNVAKVPQVAAINTVSRVNVNLTTANRYIRAVGKPAFVSGTSPTVLVAAAIILGGSDRVATS